MDEQLFLQYLRDSNLEEGKTYIQEHISELSDHATIGGWLEKEALKVLYTPFVSLKLAELLIFFGDYVGRLSSHTLGLKAKGDALVQIGHYQAAIDVLDGSGEEFKQLGDEGNWARSRISWVLASPWLGRMEEGLQQGNLAREVFLRLNEYYWICVLDSNVALIYYYIGEYQNAIKLYDGMLSIYPNVQGQSANFVERSIAIAQMNQALNFVLLGNYEKAYHLYLEAHTTFVGLQEIICIIYTEVNLAELDYFQSYYGSALRRYYQAYDRLLQDNLGSPLLTAELKMCIGNCLAKLNRARDAQKIVNECIQIYRNLDTKLNTGITLREYATLLASSGKLKEALKAFEDAQSFFTQGGFKPYAAITKLQQAETLLDMGAISDAYDYARLVQEYFEARDSVPYSARAELVMIGALIKMMQEIEPHQGARRATILQEIRAHCQRITIQARQHNLQDISYKNHYLLGRVSILQEKYTQALRHYKAAIAQIERILHDLVYDLSPSFLHTAWAVYEETIVLCLQLGRVEVAFSYLEQARSMALRQYLNKTINTNASLKDGLGLVRSQPIDVAMVRMQRELKDWQEQYHHYSTLLANIDPSVSSSVDKEVLVSELQRCEAKISELFERIALQQMEKPSGSKREKRIRRSIKGIDLVQLRQRLTPDQLVLVYFLYKGKLGIFAITTQTLLYREVADGLEQLENVLPFLHARLLPSSQPETTQAHRIVCNLLRKLYKLLIAPVESLLPSITGSLIIVPYGPLHGVPFHALHDGAKFLIEKYQVNYVPTSNLLLRKDTPITDGQPLVFGYSSNGHLERALDEARLLATMLHGACYLEQEATIAHLMEQAATSPIIHLATHGHNRLEDAPNFSAVLLADGRLTAIDAFSLNLQGCELVTLSGCETGLAMSSGGDEQLGLGRAFLAAGAKSLVMSLWLVEDNATNELMQLFYRHLLNGESKVEALRKAQCSLLQQPAYANPYFWAAFRLVGDVGPLKANIYNTPYLSAKHDC